MNVFVLCTGRCGSTTFAEACRHITNFTAAHESNWGKVGKARLTYPDQQIEVDNRLAWMLGELDERFGPRAFYVYLRRDREETARSFERRWGNRRSIIRGFAECILSTTEFDLEVCRSYVDCVDANIRMFLKDKPQHLEINLADAAGGYREFWRRIGARGDLDAALRTLSTAYNASQAQSSTNGNSGIRVLKRLFRPPNPDDE